jgi:hypothetical protein
MRGVPARALLGLAAVLLACGFQRGSTPAASHFADWAAVVVAADWRASSGKPTAAFENARRDVSAALLGAGFRPENLRTFSVDAKAAGVGETTPVNVFQGVQDVAGRTQAGCLLYFTSHGEPKGIVFGREGGLSPSVLRRLLDEACGRRPTVVFVSACYSGVFVPALAAPNRLILTAARRDRTSFGCGEDDVYPFFDGCVLENFPRSADFLALGRGVQACVARREAELKLAPASEPQISAGAHIRPLLPLLPLRSAPPSP